MHKIAIRNVFNLISVIWQCKNIFREELLLKITFSVICIWDIFINKELFVSQSQKPDVCEHEYGLQIRVDRRVL
jgi:hypothetical protein